MAEAYEAYLVRLKGTVDHAVIDTFQVIARAPEEAALAARDLASPGQLIELEPSPLSAERAVAAGLIGGTLLLA